MNVVFERIVDLAIKSLILEASLAIKPGLVDSINNGSHSDMDIQTFCNSAFSLRSSFYRFIELGYYSDQPLEVIFKEARLIGQDAETYMYKATHSINTHKGAIFTFGLFLTAIGYYAKKGNPISSFEQVNDILLIIQDMTRSELSNELQLIAQSPPKTHGDLIYQQYGIAGARQEAIGGYPIIKETVIPYLNKCDLPFIKKFLNLLLLIMSKLDDTNIIHRSDYDTLKKIQRLAKKFIENQTILDENYQLELYTIDTYFTQLNISPGGSADLLAISIFINDLVKGDSQC